MASDNLNQVGKYINKTRQDADFALTRYGRHYPKIEASRDIFDNLVPFEIDFEVEANSRVNLDLYFNKPPPIADCNSNCVRSACEKFTVGSGQSYLTVENNYISGTVNVFINGEEYTDIRYRSTNSLWVSSPLVTNTVIVCYLYYLEDCLPYIDDCEELDTCWTDQFDREDGPPGESPVGFTWEIFSGSPGISDGRLEIPVTGDVLATLSDPLSMPFETEWQYMLGSDDVNGIMIVGNVLINFDNSLISLGGLGSSEPDVSLSYTSEASIWYSVHAYASDEGITLNIWKRDTESEPEGWMLTFEATDVSNPTFFGFANNISSSASFYIDNIRVEGFTTCQTFLNREFNVYDDFERTLSSGLGTPSSIGALAYTYGGNSSGVYSVTGSAGRADYPGTGSSSGSRFHNRDIPGDWWNNPSGFDMLIPLHIDSILSVSEQTPFSAFHSFQIFVGTSTSDIDEASITLIISSASGEVTLAESDALFTTTSKTSWSTDFYIRWQRIPNAENRLKIWNFGSAEPPDWFLTLEAGSETWEYIRVDTGIFEINVPPGPEPHWFEIDYIAFAVSLSEPACPEDFL